MMDVTDMRRRTALLPIVTFAALSLGACGSRPPATTDPSELEAAVSLAVPSGGPLQTQEATVAEGKMVFVRVRCAFSATVRIEGQHASAHVGPKHPATLVFAANTAGTYAVVVSGRPVPAGRITVVGP